MKMVVSEGFVIISENVLQMFSTNILLKMLGKTTFIFILCLLYLLVSHTHPGTTDRWALLFVLRPGIQASRHPVPPSSSSPNTQVGWPTSHPHPGVLNIHACPNMDSVMNRIICLHNFHWVPHIQFGPRLFSKGILCYIFDILVWLLCYIFCSSAKFLNILCCLFFHIAV